MSDSYSQFYNNPQSSNELVLTKPYPDPVYNFELSKQPFEDHFSSTTGDIVAPHAEEFELDLDSSFADIGDLSVPYNATTTDAFDIGAYLRSETPRRGLGSSFTASSESTSVYGSNYETNSYYSGYSPSSQYSNSFPVVNVEDLGTIDMDLRRMGIFSQETNSLSSIPTANPDLSPNTITLSSLSPASFSSRSSFSDYEPSNQIRVGSSAASDYYPQTADRYPTVPIQATVSPANVTAQLPVVASHSSPSHSSSRSESGVTGDPKRKYQCPNCPRAFARAFNLKTHVQTHDPNRAKPFICSVKTCGRSFSRKHDLMRHNVSIHRDSSGAAETVGVERGPRSRCEQCGKSWVGKNKSESCDCDDVK